MTLQKQSEAPDIRERLARVASGERDRDGDATPPAMAVNSATWSTRPAPSQAPECAKQLHVAGAEADQCEKAGGTARRQAASRPRWNHPR